MYFGRCLVGGIVKDFEFLIFFGCILMYLKNILTYVDVFWCILVYFGRGGGGR